MNEGIHDEYRSPGQHSLSGGIVLYRIYCEDKVVGKMQVKRVGLYYEFVCKCNFADNNYYTVEAIGERTVNLGLCVPVENGYGFCTRMPVKALGEGE